MNKYAEALSDLRIIEKDNAFSTCSLHPFVKRKIEILQELVNKENPMKPLKKDMKRFIAYYCPSCKNYIPFGDNYCYECGQKIDWSDEK